MKKVNDFRDLNRVSRMQDATLEKWHFLIRNLREGGQLSQVEEHGPQDQTRRHNFGRVSTWFK